MKLFYVFSELILNKIIIEFMDNELIVHFVN